jgi:hypothetical protein
MLEFYVELSKYSADVYKVSLNGKEKAKQSFIIERVVCVCVFVSIVVQERLTRQIAEAIAEAIEPRGVAVIVECL